MKELSETMEKCTYIICILIKVGINRIIDDIYILSQLYWWEWLNNDESSGFLILRGELMYKHWKNKFNLVNIGLE